LRLEETKISGGAKPGQFVQFRCGADGSFDPFLRRPFSVYSVNRAAETFDILYTTVGRGTRWMASLKAESRGTADVEGPFGNTFSLPGPEDRVYLVGGGVGVAPLYFFAEEILAAPCARKRDRKPDVTLCMGARTGSQLQGIQDFRKLPLRAETSTDDGSQGFHGRVTELLEKLLAEEADLTRVRVYGCGPQAMNESLRACLIEKSIWGEICLESLMACGFGVCFGCVLPLRKELAGEFYNRRICWEGPVFDARLLHPGIEG